MDFNPTDEFILQSLDASFSKEWNGLEEIVMDNVENLGFINIEDIPVEFAEIAAGGSIVDTPEAAVSSSVSDTTKGKKQRGRPKKSPEKLQNPKNAQRCQEQRDKAKEEDAKERKRLEQLQTEYEELRAEEEMMRNDIEEAEKIYLELIKTGQIGFA